MFNSGLSYVRFGGFINTEIIPNSWTNKNIKIIVPALQDALSDYSKAGLFWTIGEIATVDHLSLLEFVAKTPSALNAAILSQHDTTVNVAVVSSPSSESNNKTFTYLAQPSSSTSATLLNTIGKAAEDSYVGSPSDDLYIVGCLVLENLGSGLCANFLANPITKIAQQYWQETVRSAIELPQLIVSLFQGQDSAQPITSTPIQTAALTNQTKQSNKVVVTQKNISTSRIIKKWQLISGDPSFDICTSPTYAGEAQVRGWYEYAPTVPGNNLPLHIADGDEKFLPLYNKNLNSTVILRDATPELEKKLKNASKNNPVIIDLKSYGLYCEDEPYVSSENPIDSWWMVVKDNETGITLKVPDNFNNTNKQELSKRQNIPSSILADIKIAVGSTLLGGEAVLVIVSDNPPNFNNYKVEKKEVYSGNKKGVQYLVNLPDYSGIGNSKMFTRIFQINNKFVSVFCNFDTASAGKNNPICESILDTISL